MPNIRDAFGLNLTGLLALVGAVSVVALALQIPIASLSDRHNRVLITWVGALAWAFFSLLTGLAWSVIVLGIARAGSGIGKAVVDPTHNSLIADYYDIPSRPRVYSFHRAANAVGAIIGPLTAGIIAYRWGWRWPFIIFTFPTLIFVVLAWRLARAEARGVRAASSRSVRRGGADRRGEAELRGVVADRVEDRQPPPHLVRAAVPRGLAHRLLGARRSPLRADLPLGRAGRGVIAACVEPAQLIGLIVGARIATRVMAKGGAEAILGFLSKVAFIICVGLIVFALAPYLWVTIVVNFVITGMGAILAPGIFAALSLAIPPRARSMGFSVASLWIIPGLVILPIIGYIGDHAGLRTGMLLMTPLFLIGGLILGTTKNTINSDIADVWRATAARSEVAYERAQGRAKLLLVRGLEVSYGSVQVLFDVDMEVDEGTCVALLGTNGAGKSTLLKAISGVVEADRGTVIFDGREMTHAPPNEIAAFGIRQVPGGQGVFLNLTVDENLHCASWLHRHDKEAMGEGIERVLALFPVLADRIDDPAGNLSGGQQQMLALGMAFLSKPRLLMIDELSLGLAPVVVAQLLPLIDRLRESGTTIILVEQSVNLALTVADTAYFMERGQIRFHGPTAELLNRPDLMRSVFIEGASSKLDAQSAASNGDDELAEIAA